MGYKKTQGEPTWEAWFAKRHPETGKPISFRRVGLSTEGEAKRIEKLLIGMVLDKIKGQRIPLWPELILMYLDHCRDRGLALKTIYNAEKCLGAATGKWQHRRIDEITTDEIRLLLVNDFSDHAATYRKAILKFVRGAFMVAVEKGLLLRNPVPTMVWRTETKLKRVLTEEQARRFLHLARELNWEWYSHCALALYTGMRNGELFALRWDRVNLKDRLALVDQSWNNKDGFKSTKSGDDRMIELAPAIVPLLEELRLQTYATGFVLPRLSRWEKGEQARELRMFLLGAGLPEIRFHDLRASWATLMMSKGVEPIKVMIMGGWKDLKTMQIYMRKAGVDIRGITSCLELHSNRREIASVLSLAEKR